MSSVRFSVVIPTYNRAHLILKTLNSVLNQSFRDFEILVVDNCSTDNTCEVLSQVLDSGKVKFIRHDRNYERAKSRNTGMENAQGEYVTFLDSDDLMWRSNLEDADTYIMENPDIRFFHNLYNIVSTDNKMIYSPRFPRTKNLAKAIASGNFLSCIGVFIHKEVYQGIRFDTNSLLTGSEDHEFWLRVAAKYSRLGRINKVNSSLVSHGERSFNIKNIDDIRRRYQYIIKKIQEDTSLSLFYEKYIHRIESASFLYMAVLANLQGLYGAAVLSCWESFRKDSSIIYTLNFLRTLQISIFRLKIK